MKIYTIRQATEIEKAIAKENNGTINKGHEFELAFNMHIVKDAIASTYRVDNRSYKWACDVSNYELKSPRAQVGEIKDDETLETFAKRRTAEGKADLFAIGFPNVVTNRYVVIELTRDEMTDFIVRYGKIDRSAKSGQNVVRLEGIRSAKLQRNCLERYGW